MAWLRSRLALWAVPDTAGDLVPGPSPTQQRAAHAAAERVTIYRPPPVDEPATATVRAAAMAAARDLLTRQRAHRPTPPPDPSPPGRTPRAWRRR